MNRFAKGLSVAIAGLLMSGAAVSAPVERDYTINAAGNCNGALPSYEGELRKRPLGIQNEGDSPAFVTCSVPGDYFASGNLVVAVAMSNQGAAPVTVNCTFVDGVTAPFGEAMYYPQAVEIAPGSVGVAEWNPAEGEAFSSNANVSCNVPVGAAINFVEVVYLEDNGVE